MSAESTRTAMDGDNLTDFNSDSTEAMERYLTFRTDNLIFGVSTNYIIEIITNHVITAMPMMPNYVKGIINLRGQIVPIIDIRLRLGKPAIEYTSTTCVIVLNVDSVFYWYHCRCSGTGSGYRLFQNILNSSKQPGRTCKRHDFHAGQQSGSASGLRNIS